MSTCPALKGLLVYDAVLSQDLLLVPRDVGEIPRSVVDDSDEVDVVECYGRIAAVGSPLGVDSQLNPIV